MKLKSERLEVLIDEPGSVYRGSRWDWASFIRQVTLDAKYSFCVNEPGEIPKDWQGTGICSEFGIFKGIGYDEAKVGEWFPKIGVGSVQRTDQQGYRFYHPYPVKPFEFKFEAGSDTAVFHEAARDERGYAVSLKRTVVLVGEEMRSHYELKNEGTKPIATDEYCHNFFLPTGVAEVNGDLTFTFPFDLHAESTLGPVVLDGRSMTFSGPIPAGKNFRVVLKDIPRGQDHWWELIHKPTGLGVRETSDFSWKDCSLWGVPGAACAEVFADVSAKPGEEVKWTRRYTFFQRKGA